MTEIISRAEWGAKAGQGGIGDFLRDEIIIHTAAGGFPGGTVSSVDDTLANESRIVLQIEEFHTRSKSRGGRGWAAIGYSFLIAPSGRIYEGRGWGRNGAHTQAGRNYTGYGICLLGHGDNAPATEEQWAAAAELIREGIRIGAITPNYVVTGHRNYARKSCPGNLIYPHIGRLRGLSPTTKDWFDMASKDDLRKVVREELAAASRPYVTSDGKRQLLVDELNNQAVWIRDPDSLQKVAGMFGVRETGWTPEYVDHRFEVS